MKIILTTVGVQQKKEKRMDKEFIIEIIELVGFFLFCVLFLIMMHGCINIQTEQTVKLEAIEAGLHQDDNGNWTK